ncbi:hypothetical protein AHAS_Ahas06G0147300 [Arachis hypogaea]
MLAAFVEKWQPETHTFVMPVVPADRVVRQYGYAQSPHWQHKPYQLTHIAILFGEFSTMTGTGFMMNGYNDGVTAATVVCEIGVCN